MGNISGYSTSKIVSGCSNLKSVTGQYQVGGIVGFSYGSQIRNCYNEGEVHSTVVGSSSDSYSCGGIVGTSQQDCTIENCYNIGNVKGYSTSYTHMVGGIVGYNHFNGVIRNCYNGGTVSQSQSGSIGGIVGRNYNDSGNLIEYSYSEKDACSNLYGSTWSSTGISTTTVAKFTHSSPITNTLSSSITVNDTAYNALLSVLKAWVTANGNTYLTWVNATSESDNKGMPKFKTCTPISTTITSVTSSHRKNVVVWTSDPQNPTCTYSVSWTSSAGNGNSSATSPFNHTSLTNDASYCYRVVAVGTGDYCDVNEPSAQVCGTPHCTHLDAPTLNIQSSGDRTVTVGWGTVSGALSYRLDYGSNSSNMWEVTPDSNPYTVLRLTNGQTYNFKVKAVGNDEHCGEDNPFSTPIKQATPNCP